MKPMLPTLTFDFPEQDGFLHEVKYDGFRAILRWDKEGISITSRNGNSLLQNFPEIPLYLRENVQRFLPYLPIQLDGEIVSLVNPYKAKFASIQTRGRLKSSKKISEASKSTPCHFMAFDVLMLEGKPLSSLPFHSRKEILKGFFKDVGLDLSPDPTSNQILQYVTVWKHPHELWGKVVLYDGEGIVSKKSSSTWEEGKRSTNWLKYKNWKLINCFVTAYEKSNGYFYIAVYKNNQLFPIGQVLFGFSREEKSALSKIIKENKIKEDAHFLYVKPAICLQVKYLEMYDSQLREPHFHHFRYDLLPSECIFEQLEFGLSNLPEHLQMTHPEKPIWESMDILKRQYIEYLLTVGVHMLPFLKDRLLTVIRYPHGISNDAFFQKNCPDYAPSFVDTFEFKGTEFIVCQKIETLFWLGNQLAIEFHIPFDKVGSSGPEEIVFDLDPPSSSAFHLAVKAALFIKEVLDGLNLKSFVKTSGSKGLQIYIPLPENTFTYEDTRLFTQFVANYLTHKGPDYFTIERLKKNRAHRLYVDYLQHDKGKTIITPYSARGNQYAGVATPLYWEEITETLKIEDFNIHTTVSRLKSEGNPFKDFFQIKKTQPFEPVLQFLKQQDKPHP